MSHTVRRRRPPFSPPPCACGVGGIDPNLAVSDVRSLEDILDGAAAPMAFTMILIIIAASVALMLGVIGIHGVMSCIVSQRTGEIGIRLALGADPGQVAGMIVRQGGLVAIGGLIVGLGLAYAGSRLVASLLYGVSARDPVVFAATTVLLLAVALAACWLPARRGARLSPWRPSEPSSAIPLSTVSIATRDQPTLFNRDGSLVGSRCSPRRRRRTEPVIRLVHRRSTSTRPPLAHPRSLWGG